MATWPCNPHNPKILEVSGADLGFGTIEYAYKSLNALIAFGWNQDEENWFRNFWEGKFEAGNEKIASSVVDTNRTSFACSNGCGDAKKFKNLFNLLFTGQGFKCDGEKVTLPPLAGSDIEANLDFIILDLMPQLPFGHAPSPFSSDCGAVDPNSGGAESGVVGDLWLSYKVRNEISFRKSQELINEYVMFEFNMLGEVDKMAAWSTAMNARLRDPLKLLEQKALAYDSEDGFENFRNCLELEGRRKKRLSRRRGLLSWIFENDAPAAEEDSSINADVVLMSSTGRSLLDAHSGDTLNLADTDSDEDAAISAYGKLNLLAMEEDTWDFKTEQSGLKDSAPLISQLSFNPPSDISNIQLNPEGMIQNGCEPGCESCPFQVDVDTDGSNKFKIGTLVSPKVRVTRGSTYTFNSTTVMHAFRFQKQSAVRTDLLPRRKVVNTPKGTITISKLDW